MSRITYVKCDRCGKQFIPDDQHKVGWIGMTWRIPETDDLENGVTPYEHCDFCESCMKAISDFIESRVVIEQLAPPEVDIVIPKHDEPVEEESAEDGEEAPQKGGEPSEEPKPKKNPPKKKGVDTGKIKALSDAGWSKAKIADEMGISVKAVYYHLDKIKQQGGDADDRSGASEA